MFETQITQLRRFTSVSRCAARRNLRNEWPSVVARQGAGLVGVTWVSRVRAVETEKWLGDVVFFCGYPVVNIHITMEITIFNG